jgi:hypothetical protein
LFKRQREREKEGGGSEEMKRCTRERFMLA